MQKAKWYIFVVLSATLTTTLFLYFFKFHSNLSSDTNDWMAFGNFFAGIASMLNVIIFVWLTLSIQKADDNSRKQDRDNQKALIIHNLGMTN